MLELFFEATNGLHVVLYCIGLCTVDAADLSFLFAISGPPLPGDANGDGLVNAA